MTRADRHLPGEATPCSAADASLVTRMKSSSTVAARPESMSDGGERHAGGQVGRPAR